MACCLRVYCPPVYDMCSMRVLIKFCCAQFEIEAMRINASCGPRANAFGDWRLQLWTMRPSFQWLLALATTRFNRASPNKPPTESHSPGHGKYMNRLRRWSNAGRSNAGTKLVTPSGEKVTCHTCSSMGANRGPSDLRSDAFPTQLSRLMPLEGRMGPIC